MQEVRITFGNRKKPLLVNGSDFTDLALWVSGSRRGNGYRAIQRAGSPEVL